MPVVRELMALGATLDDADGTGTAALLFVSTSNQDEIIRLLLGLGADTRFVGPQGSALIVALGAGHAAVVNRLAGWP
jgi:hypothetical protein